MFSTSNQPRPLSKWYQWGRSHSFFFTYTHQQCKHEPPKLLNGKIACLNLNHQLDCYDVTSRIDTSQGTDRHAIQLRIPFNLMRWLFCGHLFTMAEGEDHFIRLNYTTYCCPLSINTVTKLYNNLFTCAAWKWMHYLIEKLVCLKKDLHNVYTTRCNLNGKEGVTLSPFLYVIRYELIEHAFSLSM